MTEVGLLYLYQDLSVAGIRSLAVMVIITRYLTAVTKINKKLT
jgi:hypothetical protein